tara:strand:- start:532 stop:654 length:123 start_codon:yes stop_codon:yes gene_type:complete
MNNAVKITVTAVAQPYKIEVLTIANIASIIDIIPVRNANN